MLDRFQMLMPASTVSLSIVGKLGVGELELGERADGILDLIDTAGADQRRRRARIAQHPGERHLRQRLAALRRDVVQRADGGEVLLR